MRYFAVLCFSMLCCQVYGQTGQINIPRVDLMPDSPSPYFMRDWKAVAEGYDEFIYDQERTGIYLPVLTLKSSGRNYPELEPIQLDSYVGTNSQTQAEAINIIPSIVGASLVGIDKSDQAGVNWVEKLKDFFNLANGQHVYLNGTNSSSGNDWWYDVMPNVFFYQTYDLYPDVPGFEEQFISVADRWLQAVQAMGGQTTPWTTPSMNYRGWYLSTMTGNNNGVKEPEAAGAISWLLYQAYSVTGDDKYFDGAQMCMEYLNSLASNPSYELQLPYGILTAARLNATEGSGYDIEKMVNWTFDRGPLRGWGTIVGNWDGNDVSGLIGEANDNGNDYAFMMNGYQHAAALAPVAKYDKRFARAIAKWMLNLANASRFYYPDFRPEDKQDDFAWSNEYDPQSVIGYEALKEMINGHALYGTGDAKRNGWAATNLGLYGSSHVGYLAAIVEPTDVEKILRLDLNKTDFFADNTFTTALLFNPHSGDQQVTLNEGVGPYDVYDAISESVIGENFTGNFQITIKSNEVVLLTFLPHGTVTTEQEGKLMAGEHVIDYHYGYDFLPDFRIKSLASDETIMEFDEITAIYVDVDHAPGTVTYDWFINDEFFTTTTSGEFSWTAPSVEGNVEIRVNALSGGITLKDSITISVLENVPVDPFISSITTDQSFYFPGATAKLIAHVDESENEHFTYDWIVSTGDFVANDSLLTWIAPAEGLYVVKCIVTNDFDVPAEKSINVLVKSESGGVTDPLAYYPLNFDELDYSGNEFHAGIEGTQEADDAMSINGFAKRFSSDNDVIYVNNNAEFNFRDAITLSFWISPGSVGHEAFVLSHGSWEERWKVSITPSKKLRWTVKTGDGIVDLDSSEPLVNNAFIHVTVVYSGYAMEIYIDGELDTFTSHTGLIETTNKQITFGQKDFSDRQYYYNGVLDEVRIYDSTLQPDEISLLPAMWHDEAPTAVRPESSKDVQVFPNPVRDGSLNIVHPGERIKGIHLFSLNGENIPCEWSSSDGRTRVNAVHQRSGIIVLRIDSTSGTVFRKVVFN